MEYQYRILQLKEGHEYASERFISYDNLLEECGHEPDPTAYKCTYEGCTECQSGNISKTLNDLYVEFNAYHPDNFYGHSLSVSDVIILKANGDSAAYYVDSIGFKKLDPEFAETVCRRRGRTI